MLELLCGAHGSLQAMGQANYINGFELTCHDHAVDLPLKWRKPQMIFVNSMSDLFHKNQHSLPVLKTIANKNPPFEKIN